MSVNPIPKGFHTVTPYLIVDDVQVLLDFVQQAFDARIDDTSPRPDGKIAHAQFQIGSSKLMAGGAGGEFGAIKAMLYLYVEDCDAVFKKAVDAGAKVVRELKDEFYGDRTGGLEGPCGIQWWIGTHIEDVSDEDMAKRAAEAHADGKS